MFLGVFLILFLLVAVTKNANAALHQGVTAGSEEKCNFIKDMKSGKVKKAKPGTEATDFTDDQSGEKFTSICTPTDCGSADPGEKSVKDNPFSPDNEGCCKKVFMKANGQQDCKPIKIAQEKGDKKMDFVPPQDQQNPPEAPKEEEPLFKSLDDLFKQYPSTGQNYPTEQMPDPGKSGDYGELYQSNPGAYCKTWNYPGNPRCQPGY